VIIDLRGFCGMQKVTGTIIGFLGLHDFGIASGIWKLRVVGRGKADLMLSMPGGREWQCRLIVR
jgi:hypothetical protein